MTIRKFLMSVSIGLFSIGGYFHIRYYENLRFQETHNPVEDYYIIDIKCSKTTRGSSRVKIGYEGNSYSISVPRHDCPNITYDYFKGQLYYIEDKDELFYEYDNLPSGIPFLCYLAGIIIPLVGFIVYRKELDNHYSTM